MEQVIIVAIAVLSVITLFLIIGLYRKSDKNSGQESDSSESKGARSKREGTIKWRGNAPDTWPPYVELMEPSS